MFLCNLAGRVAQQGNFAASTRGMLAADAKQVLLCKGWVLKQRLYMMFNHVSGQLLPEHTWNPRCAPSLSVDSCSVSHQGNCCASTREIPPLNLHPHTRHTEMFMRQDCCACTPQAHLDLSPCAKRHVPAKKLLRSHAWSTVGSLSMRKKPVHTTTRLRSHAVTTLGSHSVRKETCSGKTTAAFSRQEHSWISLRAHRNMFHRKDSCDLALTPR